MTVVLSFPISSVSKELQDIFEVWHKQSGCPRAVPHPRGEVLPSPVLSRQSVVWGGCSPPLKKQGLAPGSSEAQWLQWAHLPGQKVVLGPLSRPVRDPRIRVPTADFV